MEFDGSKAGQRNCGVVGGGGQGGPPPRRDRGPGPPRKSCMAKYAILTTFALIFSTIHNSLPYSKSKNMLQNGKELRNRAYCEKFN